MSVTDDKTPAQTVRGTLETPPGQMLRRRRRRPKWRRRLSKIFGSRLSWINLFIVVASVVTIAAVLVVVLVTNSINRVDSSLASLSRAVAALERKPTEQITFEDFQRLQANVGDLVGSLSQARRQLTFLEPLESLNDDLSTRLTSLDAAFYLSLAAREMLTGLQPTLFFLSSGDDSGIVTAQLSSTQRVVEQLRLGRGQFADAARYLTAAQDEIKNIDLSELSADRLFDIQDLQAYHGQLTRINSILAEAPDLLETALGLTEERTYLILSQNSDEIRPSGGFISTYGWMIVENGQISDYNYGPVTPTDPSPPPPEVPSPQQVSLLPDSGLIRSAWLGGWYADFPTTAEMGMWFYNYGNNPQAPVDGVIAIDIVGFEYLIEALGSVRVRNYNVEVSRSNFREVIYDIRASGEGDLPHKRFLAALYGQIINDWQNADREAEESAAVLGALLRAVSEKHIMIYFADEGLNEAMSLLAWSGEQSPAVEHDYLMVTDANLRNKSNRSIIRQLTYDVEIQADGSLLSRTTVAYDYLDRIAANDPAVNADHHGPLDYTNVLQLFVPAGSVVAPTESFGNPAQPVDTPEHTVFVTNVTIPYDSSERLQFSYHTPSLITSLGAYNQYRLLLQKQPGTLADEVNVQVALPPSAEIIDVWPNPVASYYLGQPILEFRLSLATDEWIEIVYSD